MGNLETLTTVKDCADYICCSSHVLRSYGEVLTEFVHGLVDKGNAEDAMAQMFERNTPFWQNEYRDELTNPFFDIADYAHKLANETGDAQMKTIATVMDNAFKEAFIHYRDVSWCQEHLDHYTLSVCLVHQLYYTYDYKSANPTMLADNFDEGYEQSDFHKLTGWGNWLRMNEQRLNHNPQSGGGGALE